MFSKNLFGFNTSSCSVESMDFVLNNLEELGDKEFLVLTGQHNIETFSCCLRLLPSCSSTYRQTNVESAQISSEGHVSVSRIRSSHLLLEVIVHVAEQFFFKSFFVTGYA